MNHSTQQQKIGLDDLKNSQPIQVTEGAKISWFTFRKVCSVEATKNVA